MINKNSVSAVNNSVFSKLFVKPLYDSYCFANIPQTIKNILTGEKKSALPEDILGDLPKSYDKVVLFFIDAFGWRFFEKYQDKYPFLKKFIEKGVISKLTSQFPSTTAAHVTCIHTGLVCGESGIFEWNYYEPKLDAMISPLLFSFAGTHDRNGLYETGISPKDLYPTKTVYKDLKEKKIKSYIFQHEEYTPSPFSDVVFEGAEVHPYKTISEALTNLSNLMISEEERSYFFLYYGKIDSMGHIYGPTSPQFEAEVDTFLTAMERIFISKTEGKLENTLLLMTADHGMADISPQTVFYLNNERKDFEHYTKRNKKGELLVAGGSCRDMFLYIKDEYVDEVIQLLRETLKGKAEVYKTEDLIKMNFFSSQPVSDLFLQRVGNIVVLSYNHQSVWWYQQGKWEQKFYGHHGGLAKEEMETILLAYNL